ncbi:MAG TPA: cytochrome d ubiquinol oxidase subunit II [Candidatus Aquilonibacter sp.]|nr:cytochrome d ubiquinol oxidase subunit II [Candidatus Aquilonibacter sp.]
MIVAAFVVIAFVLTAYVLFDGYDLGVATIAPLVAKNDRERLAAMQAIGPFWNGNEVFLIAGGAMLFALFPRAYASSFSGFYLPFIIVLWLLMGRGIALELREHFPSAMWHQFWDACFTIASALLVLLFGVALGNLIRGVPLDAQGFFMGTFGFLLNWYALLVGVFAVVALAMHGAAFLALRVEGSLNERAFGFARRLWPAAVVLFVSITAGTFVVHPAVGAGAIVLGLLALAALVVTRVLLGRRSELGAFASSSAFLALLMAAAAATLFPYLLPAFAGSQGAGISIFDAAPSAGALASALAVSIVGLVAVAVYGTIVWRMLAGKVRVGE